MPHRQRLQRDPLHISPDDPERSRLFPRGTLLGLGLLCAAALALVYPGHTLMQMLATSKDDALAIDYLRHLVQLRGGDAGLQVMLAQRYFRIGERQQALDALRDVHDPQADALRLQIWKSRWYAADAAGERARAARARGALSSLLLRFHPADYRQWRETVAMLLGLGEPDAARRLAPEIVRFLPLPPTAARETARLLVGLQDYPLAAQVLFTSAGVPLAPAERDALMRDGANALLASGDPVLAYRRTEAAIGQGAVDAPLAWFMVQLALGANDAAGAARWLQRAVNLDAPAAELGRALAPPQRELAWRVLLAASDLPGAVRIADAALAATPADRSWAERRAQVLEWSGRADAAMQQWIALLRSRYSDHALDEVHRLALALHSSSGMDVYWEERAAHGTMTADEWLQYAQALEVRGDPQRAVAVLRHAADTLPQLLTPLAWLLGNMGEVQPSLRTYAEALQRRSIDLQASIDYAIALLQTGAFEVAREALLNTQSLPGPAGLRAAHQGLLGDLSWDMGQTQGADAAYAAVWNDPALRPRIKPYQLERLLILTRTLHGAAAALNLAPRAWAQTQTPALAQIWLQLLVAKPSLAGIQLWQDSVHRSPIGAALFRNADTYAARAQVWQALGRRPLAVADLREALRLSPGNTDDEIALLWMCVDGNEADCLRRDVPAFAPALRRLPDGLEVLSAASQALGDTPQAVAYSQLLYPQRKTDPLWMINYGDLLAQSGDDRRARAAYDRAWALLQRPAPRPTGPARRTTAALDALIARLRLSHDRLGATGQQALLGQLRAKLADGKLGPQETRKANAAIADWLLHLDTTSAARWWLARRALTPAARQSVQVQIDLREGDREAVDADLRHGAAQKLLPQDRAEAEHIAGHPMRSLAQAEAVLDHAAETGQDSAALRALSRQTAEREIALAHVAGVAIEHRQIGDVVRQGPRAALGLQLGRAWRLHLQASRQTLGSNNAAALMGVPPRWIDALAGVEWTSETDHLAAALTHNTALGTLNGWTIDARTRLPWAVQANLQIERHAVADESGVLQIAGGRDRVQLQLRRDFGRIWGSVSTAAMRYMTRSGDPLGRGDSTQAELGMWLRYGVPDLSVKLLGYSNRFQADAGPPLPAYSVLIPGGEAPSSAFFIPAGDDAYGVGFGFNSAHADGFSGRWLPYGEVDALRSRRLGFASNLNVGVRGPLFGADQLSLSYQRQQDTSGLNRQWTLQYRLWFGR